MNKKSRTLDIHWTKKCGLKDIVSPPIHIVFNRVQCFKNPEQNRDSNMALTRRNSPEHVF